MPREYRPPPFRRMTRQTVLHRIEIDVIGVSLQIVIVPDDVFPEPPLPDSALASRVA